MYFGPKFLMHLNNRIREMSRELWGDTTCEIVLVSPLCFMLST